MQDVAELSGVSTATVSYILNGRNGGRSRISEPTRKHVLNAVRKLGYSPNASARNLRRRRTDRICMVIPNLRDPYYNIMAKDLLSSADAHGYSMVIIVIGSLVRELHMFNELRQGLADGALIVGTCFLDETHFVQIAESGIATVIINNLVQPKGFDVVKTDEDDAQEQAVDHLLGEGHTRIALFSNHENINQVRKIKVYLRLLQERRLVIDHHLIQDGVKNRYTAYQVTQSLLRLDNPPTAILTVADTTAIGALLAARDTGIRVPDDLAIIGSGNIPETEITTPPLTTIGQRSLDFQDISDLLFSRLSGKAPPEGRIYEIPRKLIIRGSS